LSALRPDLPPAVVRVVQRLMAREVEDRYASAAAVALDVAALCSHRPVLQRVESKKSTTPPPRRSRRLARFLFAALAFALLGGAAGSGAHRMLVPPPGTSSRSQTPRSGSFTIEGQAAAFASLEKAINAANDGDIITIHGSGPFRLTPLAWQGKALTIRAAHGVRPRLEMKPGDAPWQALLQTDRDLNLEGLDLAITEETPIAAGSAAPPLLCCRQAPLSLTNCRLTGGTAATAISARNAGNISLRGCVIEAGAVALSLEVGQQGPGRLELIDCWLNVRAEAGAALCLWGEEGGQAVPVELSLQGNTIQAGRIAALRDRPVHLTIAARDNQFRYRTALLSFSGCANRAVWRDTLWQGGGNRYEGPASWFWVDGRPVAPTPLPVAR
jgi:hypothetical protein